MAKMTERRRVHCPVKHVSVFIITWDDGNFTVKCGDLRTCGDSCPFLKDPNYKSPFSRAPKYEPK